MTAATPIKPLAITMGDPAGVGPELIAALWQQRDAIALPPFVCMGNSQVFAPYLPADASSIISDISEATEVFTHSLPILEQPLQSVPVPGEPTPDNGACVISAIDSAVQSALDGQVSAIVTAPISKEVLYSAGFTAPGHTEYLARLCGLRDDASVMMLTAKDLRVIPVTIHIPLKDVPSQLTADRIYHAGMVAAHDLKTRFGIDKPRIAIAGLNPHAGEGGTIGIEEATHIKPAIFALRDEGIMVTDPMPADTLFHEEARQNYDVVLCMYHDQALIPVKTLDFWGGVNVTLGLPFIRTSPDHGTAFNVAGKGIARKDSMLAAIRLAAKVSANNER